MYPKLSKRQSADGDPSYTYVCKMKERSKRQRCNCRNANGNNLDGAIIEQIKSLTEQESTFLKQMDRSRCFFTGNPEQYEAQVSQLQAIYAENEKNINGLMDALSLAADSIARPRILKRIEDLTGINREVENRIQELEGRISSQNLNDEKFDILRQMLVMFRTSIDGISVEEKRQAVRAVVRKVIWDGTNAHVMLFGAVEGEVNFLNRDEILPHGGEEAGEEGAQKNAADVDYGDFAGESGQQSEMLPGACGKIPW